MQLTRPVERNALMMRLCLEAWLMLLYIELVMMFRSSTNLRTIIRKQRVADRPSAWNAAEVLSPAMDLACVLYFKPVLCLQRSAATTLFMRRHGVRAQMITGAQILPPEFHAWVEVDGTIVNDKPYMHEIYQVLERH